MKKQRRGQAQNLLNNNQPILDESSRLKLEIDQKRLDLEIEKFKRENSFWHKFGGNIIQAVVGAAVLLLIAYSNYVQNNTLNKQRQLDMQRVEQREIADKAVQKEQQDREWKLKLVEFLKEHKATLSNGTDEQKIVYAKLIPEFFPKNLAVEAFQILEQDATPNSRRIWYNGRNKMETTQLSRLGLTAVPTIDLIDYSMLR